MIETSTRNGFSADPHDTKNWQRIGSTVFLLEHVPGRYCGTDSATQNKFTIHVQTTGRDSERREIAKKIVDALNSHDDPCPIETAPQDGTEIFGYCPDIGWRVLVWSPSASPVRGNGWVLAGSETYEYEPSHWKPMPK